MTCHHVAICPISFTSGIEKQLMDPSHPLLHLLLISSPSPPYLLPIHFLLAPLTLTHILPTFKDLTQQQPPISPTHAVIGHSRCVAQCVCVCLCLNSRICADLYFHRQDVYMFQTPFLCSPKGFGEVYGLRSGSWRGGLCVFVMMSVSFVCVDVS